MPDDYQTIKIRSIGKAARIAIERVAPYAHSDNVAAAIADLEALEEEALTHNADIPDETQQAIEELDRYGRAIVRYSDIVTTET
jgi:hypothetical protein